jgi:hypothetical protein
MADHHPKSLPTRRLRAVPAGALVLAIFAAPACTPLNLGSGGTSSHKTVKAVSKPKPAVKKPAPTPTPTPTPAKPVPTPAPTTTSPAATTPPLTATEPTTSQGPDPASAETPPETPSAAPSTSPSATPTPTVTPTPTPTSTKLPSSTVGPQAKSADSLVDAFGVNVHMNATRGRYGDVTAVVNKLTQLNARHVRDVLYINSPKEYAALNTLASNGIKSDLVLGRPDNAGGTPQQLVDLVATTVRPATELVEGANEWDLQNDPGTWYVNLRNHQKTIYNLIKSNPATKSIPVLMPALGKYSGWDLLGSMTSMADYGNAHIYPGGRVPTFLLDSTVAKLKVSSGNMPIMTTEAGFTDAMNNTSTHLPTPQDVEGVYAPRLLLEHYIRGEAREYQYELIDERDNPALDDKEAHFGLLNYDWSPKPEYTALSNMLGLLVDKGASFGTGKLDYQLTGSTTGVKQLLLQKRDGTFYLLLWRDASIYDPIAKNRLPVTNQNVTVTLPGTASASVYRPSVQSGAVQSAKSTSTVNVSLGADVQMIKIG